MNKSEVMVRIYIIDVSDLLPMDIGSLSDPYIKVILGKQKKNNRNNYQLDKVNCDIHEYFEFTTSLPGP